MKKINTTKVVAKKGMSKGKMAGVAGAVAGAAALGAGAYYLMGPKGKAHQNKIKSLMQKMEKEAKSKLKMAKDMTEPMYHMAVDTVASAYSNQYKEHEGDIKVLAKRMKNEWKNMKGMPAKAKGAAKKVVKKAVNTLAKKAVKKTTTAR